jgi:hypothetical protein
VTELLSKHTGAIVRRTGEKDNTWMGVLHKNDLHLKGNMMIKPRPGVNTLELSDWCVHFFHEDVRVVGLCLKEKTVGRPRRPNSNNKFARTVTKMQYELSSEQHQKILESLQRDCVSED